MLAGVLITIREGLEAFLIIGILLGYLAKINQRQYFKQVWVGAISAVVVSGIGSYLLQLYKISFEEERAESFEIIVALIAISVLSYMIIWMQRQSNNIKGELMSKMDNALSNNQVWGIAILAFVTVIREGIETALFLTAVNGEGILMGAIIGLLIAALMSVLLYRATLKLNLKRFFLVSGWLLILVAAGLMSHTFHALAEVGIVPELMEGVWNLEGFISNESLLGKILHAFIGYESSPSLIQVIAYSVYVFMIGWLFMRKPKERHN